VINIAHSFVLFFSLLDQGQHDVLQVRGDARNFSGALVYLPLGILRGLVKDTDGVGAGLHEEVADSLFLKSDDTASVLRVVHLSLLFIPRSSQGVILVALLELPDYFSVHCDFIL